MFSVEYSKILKHTYSLNTLEELLRNFGPVKVHKNMEIMNSVHKLLVKTAEYQCILPNFGQFSLFVPPEPIRKPEVFSCFQGA